jgi:Protein of unknown function (DUF1631)
MNPTDPRTLAALDAALGHVVATASTAAARAVDLLGAMAQATARIFERDAFLAAQFDLRHRMPAFCRTFEESVRAGLKAELAPRPAGGQRQLASASWESLSLVDDAEVEERMFSDRISQAISHECEWELRDLAAFMGALLNVGRADQDRNPFRPEAVGAALFKAIEAASTERDTRKLLARELAPVMAKGMRLCYAEIVSDLKARGVQPVHLSIRGVEGPGNDRVTSGYATLPREETQGGGGGTTAGGSASTGGSILGAIDSRRGPMSSRSGAGYGSSGHGNAGASGPEMADAELMSLIRRLTAVTSRPGSLADAPAPSGFAPAPLRTGSSQRSSGPGSFSAGTGGLRDEGLTGLMAVNLIRAHRDELRDASSGTLDHMVIDVVGSLFDQILSDPRVSPQMARQIARLQLPVLRVALADTSFFTSRKHPVRRFVNRIASLACAFDDFDDGPGRQFLARVRELVQEIIEGDFDQVGVYAAKLTLLEAFIEQQNEGDVEAHGAAASLLDGKETELRVQQRYMQQLQNALAPVPMQDYLRDFLSQVWSQALALAVRRDGPHAERTQRLRRAASELVMSVQPKGTPALRKAFLMQLPGLMKALNEGMTLIGWPEPAQREFFGRLLPAHAESLKGQAPSELERNLLAKQLDAAFDQPLPRAETMAVQGVGGPSGPMPEPTLAPHFSAEEAARVGLVAEQAVDWASPIDPLVAEAGSIAGADAADAEETTPTPLDLGLDIDLSVAAPEPAHGPELMNHLQVGFAYQMHVKDRWQKVRLSYVSSGRSFFAFTHGRRHQETISFTSRMLARLCESGRLRAYESSYLLERATARARKQLAALKPAGTSTVH